MNDDTVIQLNNISKCYKTFENKRDRLLNILVPSHKAGIQETWALKDVSLEIKRGDSVAIIGRNGSGKSTLLEILTGTLKPTSGSASVTGRVSALLELGSGFNPQYSGRDNVILNGLLLGLRKKDILQRFAEIEHFADIGAAIDRPVKTYSSGMIMRLAFAVQVLCDPEILIIDEALSVGDFFFQQKCLNYIQALRKQGVTLLFVSHDMGAVRDLCQTGIYLKKGELTFFGKNSTAINHYLSESNTTNHAPIQQPIAAFNNELPQAIWTNTSPSTPSLLEVGLYNSHDEATTSFNIGEQLTFRVRFISNDKVHTQVMLTLRNRNSQIITSQGTYNAQLSSDATSNGIREARFDVTANLEAGQYSFTFTLSSNIKTNTGSILYETPELGPLTVHWNYETAIPPFYGMFGLPMKISYPSF